MPHCRRGISVIGELKGKIHQYFSGWAASLRKKPMRLVFAAAAILLMSVLTAYAWDGIAKRLIICVFLTFLSGVLLLLPRFSNRVSIPLLAVYLLYVPMKIFQRMELPMHDMSRIADGVELLTAVFMICIYLAVFLFTQNTSLALGLGNGFFLVLFLVEYYLWKFRGNFLMPNDLGAAGTAMSVMGNYQYDLSSEAVYSVIYLLFFIVLGIKIRIRIHKWVHVGVSVAAVLCIAGWYYTVMDTPKPLGKEFVINEWEIGDTRNMNGACLSFFLLWKNSRMDVPDAYSVKTLQEIAESAVEKYEPVPAQETAKKPAIIMIMNEAWSDLRVLGELGTTEEYMPFVDGLSENTLKGKLYVSILGGLTANTEFEALSGNSLSLLSVAALPYQNQVDHDMPSLARVLENQGYSTMAMHPSGAAAWNRYRVYPYFGFDDFVHQEAWAVPYEFVGTFISDACNFKEIIYRYENRNREEPFFLFDVTIQNHSSYYGQVPIDIDVTDVGGQPAEAVGYIYDLQTYLNLMKISDDAFREFVAYFEQVEEPVIICMFGDHQPLLGDNLYDAFFAGSQLSQQEKNLQKYITPYVIWANYDVDWKEYGDMSANYLPAVLAECAGLQMPPFYQYLMELHEKYPVLTKTGCLDMDGKLLNIEDIWDSEPIKQYRMLQYNQLYIKDYQSDIFEKTTYAGQ